MAGSANDGTDVRAAVERFNEGFNAKDIQAVMQCMTEDCIFESTAPPDGGRFTGQEAVRSCFQSFFESSPEAEFEGEEMFVAADRCVVRWVYRYGDGATAGHVRGVDVIRVRNGKVAEKLAYVKG